jgi:phage baseplate assembly protein W
MTYAQNPTQPSRTDPLIDFAGMDRTTGKRLIGMAHLRQSYSDIISTRIGSRCERRDYGSIVPELLDHPLNDQTRTRLYASLAQSLMTHEPRVTLTRIQMMHSSSTGMHNFAIDGKVDDQNFEVTL